MYLVPLERYWRDKYSAVWIISLSQIVAKLFCFKDLENFLFGAAINRDAAIKQEITKWSWLGIGMLFINILYNWGLVKQSNKILRLFLPEIFGSLTDTYHLNQKSKKLFFRLSCHIL